KRTNRIHTRFVSASLENGPGTGSASHLHTHPPNPARATAPEKQTIFASQIGKLLLAALVGRFYSIEVALHSSLLGPCFPEGPAETPLPPPQGPTPLPTLPLVRSPSMQAPTMSPPAVARLLAMAAASGSPTLRHGVSLWCPQSPALRSATALPCPHTVPSFGRFRRSLSVAAAAATSGSKESRACDPFRLFANAIARMVIWNLIAAACESAVGGGNAAGYAARTLVEHGMADGRLCIVSKEAVAPYERPALTKGYLFPLDKKPARLPGFHTCVGIGGERQTPEWYKERGIEMLYGDPVTSLDIQTNTLKTSSGKLLKYGSLIISTGCTASFLHAAFDFSIKLKKYLQIIFPENHIMPRLFTPSIAQKYEELYQENGVKFLKGALIDKLEAGSDGRVATVRLNGGSVIEADTVIVGIGAKPVVSPFEAVGLNESVGGIQVDSQFRTSVPGIFAIGDVAAFPLRIYDRMARVEHVDHARKSANHCLRALLSAQSHPYDYLPFFYSRVFEYEGSSRKVWWQFYGDNVGDAIEVGNFDPKMAAFWIDSDGRLKGVFLESGSAEEFALLPRLAREQPFVDRAKLQSASSVESALEVARSSLQIESK
ncbi:hypothetical protein Taro_012968, partial [Colocasia esculenta]|nr:hypothetical protein [Colocasia esculenta]